MHAHGDVRMHDPRHGHETRALGDERRDLALLAEEGEGEVRAPRERPRRPLDDHRWSVIAAHRVERDPHGCRHADAAPRPPPRWRPPRPARHDRRAVSDGRRQV